MKRSIIIALIYAGSLLAQLQTQQQVPYLSTFGAWTFCINGIGSLLGTDCSWYKPGTEEYALHIPASGSGVVAYNYTVTVILESGVSQTLTGTVKRSDTVYGFTDVPKLVFGGIVKSAVIEVEELVGMGKKQSVGGVRGR